MCSKPALEPRPVRRGGCAGGRSLRRHGLLPVFTFYRLDFGRCAEHAAKGEYAQANQNLFARAMHQQSCKRDMAEDELTAEYGAHRRLYVSMSTRSLPSHAGQ